MSRIFTAFFLLLLPYSILDARPKVCLNMIVKDEEQVIKRCLENVKPLIDYWVIVDTGSTDATQDIVKAVMHDVPGELHQSTWTNFGVNRTEAIRLVDGKADYVLFMDADDWLAYEKGYQLPELTKDAYQMWRGSETFSYLKPQLVKTDLSWKWIGATHEYLTCDSRYSSEVLAGLKYVCGYDGARSRDPKKFLHNVKMLEDELKTDPTNHRNMFYLAESYRDARNPRKAIECYQKRVDMKGWQEEVYWSLFQIALLKYEQKDDTDSVIEAFNRAHRYRPHRSETYYYLAQIYNQSGQYALAYECLKGREYLPKPAAKDILFNIDWIENWGIPYQLARSTCYLGRCEESLELCDRLLAMPNLPADFREQVNIFVSLSQKRSQTAGLKGSKS
ncbi:MAG: glycosyltransferase [Chlamydiales bacterium]|nr:glycosyltransferase [Chlamydiales bacterium]